MRKAPGETMVPVAEDREKKTNRRKSYREKYRSPGPLVNRVPRVGVMETICNDESSPCPVLVLLYARLGLHRYNLLHGQNLQLSSVKKYSKSTHSAASSYYITSEAMDLALQPFETNIYERTYGRLVLSCNIARPLGETIGGETIGGEIKRSKIKRNSLCKDLHLTDTMPEWPQENPFENSKLVLNCSEVQDNDWIRLYLELAVAISNRHSITNHDLSNLEIVKLAIDTTPQDVDVEFNRINVAIVYIRYKDACKDIDRVAIVRRAFDEQLGCFSLVGRTLSLGSIPK